MDKDYDISLTYGLCGIDVDLNDSTFFKQFSTFELENIYNKVQELNKSVIVELGLRYAFKDFNNG